MNVHAQPGALWSDEATPADGFRMPQTQTPLADPIVDAQALFKGRRTTAWTQGEVRWLRLQDDVEFRLGNYAFRGDQAVVRIQPENRYGRQLHHVAIFLENAAPIPGITQDVAAVYAEAPQLLITATTRGGVALETDALSRSPQPPADAFVGAAESRMAQVRQRLSVAVAERNIAPVMTENDRLEQMARRVAIAEQDQVYEMPQGRERTKYVRTIEQPKPSEDEEGETQPAEQPRLARGDQQYKQREGEVGELQYKQEDESALRVTVLPAQGQLNFSADRVVFDRTEQESIVMLIGDVRAIYVDTEADRNMTLKAERMVIFLAPDVLENVQSGEVGAGAVRGVYLEDNAIISDGAYTVRAPRVFYDLPRNQAILLEAVFYTWEPTLNIPLYMRAKVMRQTSATSFEAKQATLTNSEFYQPHLAIRADRMTVEQTRGAGSGNGGGGDEPSEYYFEAKDVTTRFNDTPFFYLPFAAGPVGEIPLEYARGGYSSDNGPIIETGWNLFSLFGQRAPKGVELTGLLDWQGTHNFGTGLEANYDLGDMFGNFDGYILPHDSGSDKIQGREDVGHDGDVRGFVHWQHRNELPQGIELSLEAAYVSDPTFLDVFYPDDADAAKQYETSIYLKKQENDWAFTFLGKYNINDFLAQSKFLEAPGYQVDKLPELGYYRIGDSLLDNRLTWFSENRLSWMRLRYGDNTPDSLGFNSYWSQQLFGMSPNTSFESAAEANGTPLGWRGRLDSRQELNAPLKIGFFDITPFVAGRVTAYDNNFDGYANNTSDDQVRLWGQAGARLHTEFSNVYEVDNRLLDIKQLRHIIEPTAEAYWSQATMNKDELPIYDPEVEGISTGPGGRIGMTNTFQTKRGGPGQWRSVDWLTIQTDFVLRADEVDAQQPIPRYYAYRPEYSTGGNHFYSELQWMVTDTLGMNGELVYSFEDNQQVTYWRVGAMMDHTPRFRTFINYNEIAPTSSRLLSVGFGYQMTRKYTLNVRQTFSFSDDDAVRDLEVELVRKMPRWTLRIFATVDTISNDTTVGFLVEPEGLSSLSLGRPRN